MESFKLARDYSYEELLQNTQPSNRSYASNLFHKYSLSIWWGIRTILLPMKDLPEEK